jgi:diguanylate cyclase (GGDEF)-like protein
MSGTAYRFSLALSAALLALSALAAPAGATHNLGLPHDPLDCVADPLTCVDGIGSGVGETVGGGLPGLGGGLPGVGGGLPGTGGGLPPGLGDGLPPGLGGGLPPGLGGGELPSAGEPPVSNPVDGVPEAVPPATEQAPESKPSRPKPESSPETSGPSTERVVIEPVDGRTTSTGDARGGSTLDGKSGSSGARSGPLRRDAITGDGPLPPASSASSSGSADSHSTKERNAVAAFAGGIIHRIPEQYRWPVFVLACMATFFALNTLRERFRSKRAEGRALTDSLTNLPNRLAFERALAKEYRRADRYDRPLSMLLLDLDGFKEINDTQGHAAGDEILRKAAVAISSRVRVDDVAARLGGDEFVVICPETSAESAQDHARLLEETLAEASIQSSIGVAEREAEDDGLPEYLVARADAAMYRCKQSSGGRERRAPAAAPAVTGLATV